MSSVVPPDHRPASRSPDAFMAAPPVQPTPTLWDRLVRGTRDEPPAFAALSRNSGYRVGPDMGEWALDHAIGIRERLASYWTDLFQRERSGLDPEYAKARVHVHHDPAHRDLAMKEPTSETFDKPTFGFVIDLRTRGRTDGADLATLTDSQCNLLFPSPLDLCTLVRCETAADDWFQTYPVINAATVSNPEALEFIALLMRDVPRAFVHTEVGKLLQEAVTRASPICGVNLSIAPNPAVTCVTENSLGIIANRRRFELRLVPHHQVEPGPLQYASWAVFDHGHEIARSHSRRAFLLLPPSPRTTALTGTLPRSPAG